MSAKTFINRHLLQIQQGGRVVLFRKMKRALQNFLKLSLTLLAIPFVLLVRIIRPLVWIRFGKVRSDVIGNSAFDAEYYLSERELEKSKTIDLFYFSTLILCNEQWAMMVRRHLRICSFVRFLDNANQMVPGGQSHLVNMIPEVSGSRDTKSVLYRTGPHTRFTEDEDKRGRRFLMEIGLHQGERFVCLLVRDSAYKSRVQNYIKQDWSYHNYRDSAVDTYEEAALALAEKGYWVFRMGKAVQTTFKAEDPRILDYSNTTYRSDFLDIWLMARCHFCLTTGTGLDDICIAFRRPIVEVNNLPIGFNRCNQAFTVYLPKKLKWKSNGKFMGLKDQIRTGAIHFFDTQQYNDLEVIVVNNTSEEIVNAVLEMEGRVNSTWQETAEDVELQKVFWEQFKTWPDFNERHGWVHPESRINASFLRENRRWFLDY